MSDGGAHQVEDDAGMHLGALCPTLDIDNSMPFSSILDGMNGAGRCPGCVDLGPRVVRIQMRLAEASRRLKARVSPPKV